MGDRTTAERTFSVNKFGRAVPFPVKFHDVLRSQAVQFQMAGSWMNDKDDLEGSAPFLIVILSQLLYGRTTGSNKQRHSG
jgi:hypothetical protein